MSYDMHWRIAASTIQNYAVHIENHPACSGLHIFVSQLLSRLTSDQNHTVLDGQVQAEAMIGKHQPPSKINSSFLTNQAGTSKEQLLSFRLVCLANLIWLGDVVLVDNMDLTRHPDGA